MRFALMKTDDGLWQTGESAEMEWLLSYQWEAVGLDGPGATLDIERELIATLTLPLNLDQNGLCTIHGRLSRLLRQACESPTSENLPVTAPLTR